MSTLDMTDEPNITTEIEEVSDASEEEVAVEEEPAVEEPEPVVEEPVVEEPEPVVEEPVAEVEVVSKSSLNELENKVKKLEERLEWLVDFLKDVHVSLRNI